MASLLVLVAVSPLGTARSHSEEQFFVLSFTRATRTHQPNVNIMTATENFAAYDSAQNSEIIIPFRAMSWAFCAKHLMYVLKNLI